MTENPNWTPPQGYHRVESHVPGVIVYAPKPKKVDTFQPKRFTCPNCGASTAYDVSEGGIACEYCGYVAPLKAVNVGRAADEFEFTLETVSHSDRGWGVKRQVLVCNSCGGQLSVPEGAISTSCPFCASNQVNVTVSLDDALRPRFLVPFKITPEQTQRLANDWLGKGWFHPNELAASTIIRRFSGIYLPFWTFDANIHAHWRAEVGYKKTYRHYNASSKSWETRTKIVWRWEEGDVNLTIDDLMVEGSAENHISYRILRQIYPYDLTDLVHYEPEYLAGWQAQAYETTLTDAWDRAKITIREQAKKACRADIPSSHVRNFSMTADFADETWRYILLPVYLAAYHYDDEVFQVMVNGQTGAVAGQKPVAWWKIWLAITAILAPGGILGIIGAISMAMGEAKPVPILLGIGLFILGLVISINLFSKARQSEAK